MKSTFYFILRGVFAVATLSCSVSSLVAQDTPPATKPAPKPATPAPTGPVATVNGDVITQEQLHKRARMTIARQMGQGAVGISDEKVAEILSQLPPEQRTALIDELINEQLLIQATKADKIEVPKEKIDEQIKNIPVPPNMDLAAFLKTRGLSEKAVRDDFQRGIGINMLIDQKTKGKIEAVTPEAIEKFYTDNPQYFEMPASVKARHILIKAEKPEDEAAAKTKIDAIRLRLVGEKAEDFATVAKETSEGPSGPNGGDLGQFGRGQMVPEFDKAVFSMKKGDVSEPIKTQFGYHVIKVDETVAAGKQPLDDALKTKIMGALEGQGKKKVIDEYIKTLRQGAEIKIS